MRGRLALRSLIALTAAIALLALASVLADTASAATLAQARSQLRTWQLQPPPLFPSQLPAGHRGANVHLYRFTGLEYGIDFGAPDNRDCHTLPNPNGWCVQLRRADVSVDAALHSPPSFPMYLRRMRVGNRNVWFFEQGAEAGGWYMVWAEQGRTYLAWAWTDKRTALRRLTPFVKSLQPLRIASASEPNWSGYVSLEPPSKTAVSTRVVLPAVTCNTSGSVSMWVGYDGWNNKTVEQDGVSAVCSKSGGRPAFHIWWELFKGNCFLSVCYSRFYDIDEHPIATSYTLAAGDSVNLYVARLAHRIPLARDKILFRIAAYDSHGRALGRRWQETGREPLVFNARYSSSECVLEAPGTASGLAALPNFGRALFTNCSVIDDAASLLRVDMVRNSRTLTTAESIGAHDDFAVAWDASS